jgi:hypothetical protein
MTVRMKQICSLHSSAKNTPKFFISIVIDKTQSSDKKKRCLADAHATIFKTGR